MAKRLNSKPSPQKLRPENCDHLLASNSEVASGARLGVEKIVSGGQTGVDRAALDVAIRLGIPHGGWCPRGRIAEDGTIPMHYHLSELDSADYVHRTRQNVIDSDATLILYSGRLTGGTALTNRIAKELSKPLHRIRLDVPLKLTAVVDWLTVNNVKVLNVAGPRGSASPQLYSDAVDAMNRIFGSTPVFDHLS